MEVKKVSLMASQDWSMRAAFRTFVEFIDPTIKFKGKEYKLELHRVIAKPLVCGEDLSAQADLVVDRTIHWNDFYKCWSHQAMNSQMQMVNNSVSFANLDKHSTYDLMARAIHPKDYFPKTVLLPQFYPYSPDLVAEERWRYQHDLVGRHTKHGHDPHRSETDWAKIDEKMRTFDNYHVKGQYVREQFYYDGNYLKETMEREFDNRFPVYLKKAFGGGGSDVFRIKSMEELYAKYDRETGGRAFHLQEAIENYDIFIRCMAIGPQVLPMEFLPDTPIHEHYSPDKIRMDKDIYSRLYEYVCFINSYMRWTYNSFECLVKNGRISPIDFANACPDSNFTSLHTHFPWLILALLRWFSFCAVTEKDMRVDLEHNLYLDILNDPKLSQGEKFEGYAKLNAEYFEVDKFNEFCEENFKGLEDQMIRFYDKYFDDIIAHAIAHSDFPPEEHDRFYREYKHRMDTVFRPNAMEYLTTVIYE